MPVVIMIEGDSDNLGDLPFILSNNDRRIIRSCLKAVMINAEMDQETAVDFIEFNHNFEDQFDAHKEKIDAKN